MAVLEIRLIAIIVLGSPWLSILFNLLPDRTAFSNHLDQFFQALFQISIIILFRQML